MKYNVETVERIVKALQQGKTHKHAAQIAGITEETFYTWKRRHRAFTEQVEQAELTAKDTLFTVVARSITRGSAQQARWLLATRWPDEYGTKVEARVSGNPDAPLVVEHKHEPASIVAFRETLVALGLTSTDLPSAERVLPAHADPSASDLPEPAA